jgi:murein DD-endopeptidase MepM/ murein hydrolase activator NlpD
VKAVTGVRLLLAAGLFAGAVSFLPAGAGCAEEVREDPYAGAVSPGLSLSVSNGTPSQGEPVAVEVASAHPLDNVSVSWLGGSWPLRETSPGRYAGIVGVDLLHPPGPETLSAEGWRHGSRLSAAAELVVARRAFPVQEMTLPKRMTEFDPPTLRRIREEARSLEERLARVTTPILWRTPFLPPVAEYRPENFGSRRVINGEERSPHAAVDIRLPEGTPVRSIGDGTVAFAGEQFFGGRSVVIDHGGGVASVYYHLKGFTVSEGQRVARGETIGAVGATGRATGPHLHFGVRVPGGRIDPSLLFSLPPR